MIIRCQRNFRFAQKRSYDLELTDLAFRIYFDNITEFQVCGGLDLNGRGLI